MSHLNLIDLKKASEYNLHFNIRFRPDRTDPSEVDRYIYQHGYCEICRYIQNIFICDRPEKEKPFKYLTCNLD